MKIICGLLCLGVVATVHADNVIENSFSGSNSVVITSGDSQSIVVNGQVVRGSNITVTNGVVFVDGKKVSTGTEKEINIVVNGNAQSVSTSTGQVTVNGDAEQINTTSGDIKVRNVNGDISTTSGDVEAVKVAGRVTTTSGQISQK